MPPPAMRPIGGSPPSTGFGASSVPSGVVELASPFVWIATRGRDGVELTGVRPAEIGASALAEQLTPALGPGTALHDRARAALGAPPDFAEAAAYALARLRALAPGGRVMLEDMRLSIVGEAVSLADDEALRTALADLPTGYSLGRVEILPAVVPDFRFVVISGAGGRPHALRPRGLGRSARRDPGPGGTGLGDRAGRGPDAQSARPSARRSMRPRWRVSPCNSPRLMQEGSVSVVDAHDLAQRRRPRRPGDPGDRGTAARGGARRPEPRRRRPEHPAALALSGPASARCGRP